MRQLPPTILGTPTACASLSSGRLKLKCRKIKATREALSASGRRANQSARKRRAGGAVATRSRERSIRRGGAIGDDLDRPARREARRRKRPVIGERSRQRVALLRSGDQKQNDAARLQRRISEGNPRLRLGADDGNRPGLALFQRRRSGKEGSNVPIRSQSEQRDREKRALGVEPWAPIIALQGRSVGSRRFIGRAEIGRDGVNLLGGNWRAADQGFERHAKIAVFMVGGDESFVAPEEMDFSPIDAALKIRAAEPFIDRVRRRPSRKGERDRAGGLVDPLGQPSGRAVGEFVRIGGDIEDRLRRHAGRP